MTIDSVIWTSLERLLSSDLSNAFSMGGRELADMLQYLNAATVFGTAGAVPTNSPRAVVLNGLELVPSGSNVAVQPGALLQYSTGLSPVPGTYDSPYRTGILRVAQNVTLGSSGSDTFYLVEAQVDVVTTVSANRDIYDPVTQTFTPTLVAVVQESQVTFQTTVGTGTVPAFSGGDWIPIGVVRRPAGGGSVAATDIIDIRPLWAGRLAAANETIPDSGTVGYGPSRGPGWITAPSDLTNTASPLVQLNVSAVGPNGERLWYEGTLTDTAPFIENGLTFSGGTWYYVYLADWRRTAPKNVYSGAAWTGALAVGGIGEGLVIVSAVAPDTSGGNSSAITPGAPWSTSPDIPAGTARLVACLKRNAGNTGWEPLWSTDGETFYVGGTANRVVSSSLPSSGSNNKTPVAHSLPAGIKSWTGWLQLVGANASPNEFDVYLAPYGATSPALSPTFVLDEAGATLAGNGVTIDVPTLGLSPSSQQFNLHVAVGGAIDGATRWTMDMVAFRI